MANEIILDFARGGSVSARLLLDEAPETCRAVLAALPFEHDMVHAMWAGEEIFCQGFPVPEPLGFENETNEITQPLLAIVSNSASQSFRHKLEVAFCVFYGKSRPRKKVDETVDVNVFAIFDDSEPLATLCKRIRTEGVEKVTVRAAD